MRPPVPAHRRLHRHRPPDDASAASSRTRSSSSSWTSSRCRSWSTTSRSAAAGCAANMCFGLGRLGPAAGAGRRGRRRLRRLPLLAGAARRRLRLTCASPRPSTPRASCAPPTRRWRQFASFYPGAMSEARLIELAPIVARVGAPSYVLIGADDPDGMLRHTEECRQRGYPFIADPSQQLAFGEGELIRDLIDGAAFLFSNEYESHMIEQKTGWSADEVLARVGIQVTTLGKDGVRIAAQRRGPDRACPPPRTSRRSSRPASATPSGPASWPRSAGARPRARRRGGLRARGVRRGDGRPAGVHVHRRASSSPGSTSRTAARPPRRSRRTCTSSGDAQLTRRTR